jgi:hypothetical protein
MSVKKKIIVDERVLEFSPGVFGDALEVDGWS